VGRITAILPPLKICEPAANDFAAGFLVLTTSHPYDDRTVSRDLRNAAPPHLPSSPHANRCFGHLSQEFINMPLSLPTAATQPAPLPMMHDVTIVTTRKLAQARVMGVPPEEFGIERGARSIRDCNYCFHEVVTKTEAQLIAEGFDEEQI